MTEAQIKQSAFTLIPNINTADTLCIQERRVVQNDNTVRYRGKVLQINGNEHRYHFAKCEVRVHEYFDGHLAVFYGPLCIGIYDANGQLVATETETIFAMAA